MLVNVSLIFQYLSIWKLFILFYFFYLIIICFFYEKIQFMFVLDKEWGKNEVLKEYINEVLILKEDLYDILLVREEKTILGIIMKVLCFKIENLKYNNTSYYLNCILNIRLNNNYIFGYFGKEEDFICLKAIIFFSMTINTIIYKQKKVYPYFSLHYFLKFVGYQYGYEYFNGLTICKGYLQIINFILCNIKELDSDLKLELLDIKKNFNELEKNYYYWIEKYLLKIWKIDNKLNIYTDKNDFVIMFMEDIFKEDCRINSKIIFLTCNKYGLNSIGNLNFLEKYPIAIRRYMFCNKKKYKDNFVDYIDILNFFFYESQIIRRKIVLRMNSFELNLDKEYLYNVINIVNYDKIYNEWNLLLKDIRKKFVDKVYKKNKKWKKKKKNYWKM